MPTQVMQSGQPFLGANANLTCFPGPGGLIGIFISSASNTPLMTVNDSAANVAGNGNAVVQQFIPAANTYYAMPARVQNGLNINVSGSIAYTVFANKG